MSETSKFLPKPLYDILVRLKEIEAELKALGVFDKDLKRGNVVEYKGKTYVVGVSDHLKLCEKFANEYDKLAKQCKVEYQNYKQHVLNSLKVKVKGYKVVETIPQKFTDTEVSEMIEEIKILVKQGTPFKEILKEIRGTTLTDEQLNRIIEETK